MGAVDGEQPMVGVEVEFKRPMGFEFQGGYPLTRFFGEAFCEGDGFNIGGESVFVFSLEEFLDRI